MLTQIRSNPKNQGAAYREFSRRRYKELKSQTMNLRESEIVAKVIREWDAMSMEQKNKYLDMKNDNMVMLNVESISTPQKGEMPMMKAKTNQKTTIEKKVQKFEIMEPSGSENMEEVNVKEFDDSFTSKGMKTKKISHPKNRNTEEYISFFKTYFDRLSKEHRSWSASQITSIIKLLWKKRKQNQSKTSKPMRQVKPMSGRKTFRKMKGLSGQEAQKMWKRLPVETRRNWDMKGNPAENKMNSMCMTLKLSQGMMMEGKPMMMPMQNQNMNFLNMKMI